MAIKLERKRAQYHTLRGDLRFPNNASDAVVEVAANDVEGWLLLLSSSSLLMLREDAADGGDATLLSAFIVAFMGTIIIYIDEHK